MEDYIKTSLDDASLEKRKTAKRKISLAKYGKTHQKFIKLLVHAVEKRRISEPAIRKTIMKKMGIGQRRYQQLMRELTLLSSATANIPIHPSHDNVRKVPFSSAHE